MASVGMSLQAAAACRLISKCSLMAVAGSEVCVHTGTLIEALPDSLLQALQESSLVADCSPSLASRAAAAMLSRQADQHQRPAGNQGSFRPSAHLTDPQGVRSQVCCSACLKRICTALSRLRNAAHEVLTLHHWHSHCTRSAAPGI